MNHLIQGHESEFLTIDEVARLLRVSTKTIYKQVLGGTMRYTRVGRQYRISLEDYDAYRGRAKVMRGK